MHCILLSHVFIRENEHHKLDCIRFALQHWKAYNPEAYIIVTGHGLMPNIVEYCDYLYWPNAIIEKDINVGHPHLVSKGLQHALQKGFNKLLKSRADTIHSIPNITQHCRNLLGDKKMLVTQQTRIDKPEMGDLFLYGDTELMAKSFDEDNWYPTKTGITSLAKNFLLHSGETDWHTACVKHMSFVDIFNIKWIDFRKNWQELKSKQADLMQNTLAKEHKYYWGAMEKWHVWDDVGNLIYSKPKMGKITTEKDWK